MVRTHWKIVGKYIAFACILCICIRLVWQILVPKYFIDSPWPTTSTYYGFYQMEENTVDVLFWAAAMRLLFSCRRNYIIVLGLPAITWDANSKIL